MHPLLKTYTFSIVPLLVAIAMISGSKGTDPAQKTATLCIEHEPSIWSNKTINIPLLYNYWCSSVGDSFYQDVVQKKVAQFYASNAYQTKWLGPDKPSALYYAFMEDLRQAAHYGLKTNIYRVEQLAESIEKLYASKDADPSTFIQQDIELTSTYFLYTTHLTNGRIHEMGHGDAIWRRPRSSRKDDIAVLNESADADRLKEHLVSFHPRSVQYTQLQAALSHYNKLDGLYPEGSLPFIRIDETIEPGDTNEAIPAVRRRLVVTDLCMDAMPEDSTVYDYELQHAVKTFQARHGLEQDGRIGKKTVAFLNMSFREKADLIELNLERARWQSEETGKTCIVVNIPEYTLKVYEGDTEALQMRVIVGKEYHSTPVFNDSISHVVFSPTWSVPQSIIRNEMVPSLVSDPEHYTRKNFKVYENGIEIDPTSVDWDNTASRYDFVQQPGNSNALGLVKFIMYNDMSVYLHDTPTDYLFQRTERAFSHGCIRLEEPGKLAAYLLRQNSEWNEESINSAMHMGAPKQVNLNRPIPVHIIYQTAWVDDTGKVHFREDIYGHDEHQMASLQQLESIM